MKDVMRDVTTRLHRRSGGQVSKAIRLWNHPSIRYVIYRGYKFYTEDADGNVMKHASREDCIRHILDEWKK